MRFNNPVIEKEYERIHNENPDLSNLKHPLINVSDALRAYFCLADYFTDESSNTVETMLIGVRSMDLLYSALGRQTISFGNHKKYSTPIDICSTLFYGMVKNHSFSDGNKRTALLVLLYQLNLYNFLPAEHESEFEKLVVAVAANSLSTEYPSIWERYEERDDPEIQTIAHLLRKMTNRKDHSYHVDITMRDMVNKLESHGVSWGVDSGKIHFERKIEANWNQPKRVLKYSAIFGGWTRSFGPSTTRDILTNLELYNQYPDYQSFMDGNEPLYNLIQKFEAPLLRLKDE